MSEAKCESSCGDKRRIVAGVELIRPSELARQLDCKEATIKAYVRNGRLVPTYIGGRMFLTAEDVQRLIKDSRGREKWPTAKPRARRCKEARRADDA